MTRERDRLVGDVRARLESSSPEQRGRIIFALGRHATGVVLLNGGLAACLALSAKNIWRRRGGGWVPAVIGGGHWKGVALLAVASRAHRAASRSNLRRILDEDGTPAATGSRGGEGW
jgi:hypothetical protein